MKTKPTFAHMGMACSILVFAGCSLWGPSSKGEPESLSGPESQHKALAGVYEDVDSNGSIKSHPLEVGTEGRNKGVDIGGGPVDLSDMRMSQNEIKGFTNQTPRSKTGETSYPSKSQGKGSPDDSAK